ncbi:MAG TPA: hypothetical protein GX707_13825 [Epulopiscium sp.]|nr:hypothetical protein [Candidatus Epulonipiscium sp.]
MERLTEVSWKNLDPWEICKQDNYCARSCHEEGGCANGCPVPRLYRKLAEYEDMEMSPEEIKELNDFEKSQISVLLKEKEKINEERKYWRNETLKLASKLREQKIEGSS